MRGSSLFMATIGALPLVTFAATLFLSDGAPFRPYGSPYGKPDGAPDATHAGPTGGPTGGTPPVAEPRAPAATVPATTEPAVRLFAVTPPDAADDPAWDRLRRLAGRGDTEAALLLTILDPPRRRADP